MVIPLFALAMLQQPDFGGAVQAEKMKPLGFLVGEWKGSGTYFAGDRKVEVECTERVESAAGGTCLLVIGKHYLIGPEGQRMLIHDAAGMIRFSLADSRYKFIAQLGSGLANEFDVEVKERGLIWGFQSPGTGATRYTMKLTEKGEWHEIGERSTDDGKTWSKFLEMTLSKK